MWLDVTREMQKLKPQFPGALEHTAENWDRNEEELGHATIAFFTIRLIGDSISTTIQKYQQRGKR